MAGNIRPMEGGKTLFTATEKIEYKNLFYRLVGYAFYGLEQVYDHIPKEKSSQPE